MYFACHGSIYNIKSTGTNNLIKEGAQIVTCVEDIVNNYEFLHKVNKEKNKLDKVIEEGINNVNEQNVQEEFKDIYRLINQDGVNINEIFAKTGKSSSEINYVLTMLEIDGFISKKAGNTYILNN